MLRNACVFSIALVFLLGAFVFGENMFSSSFQSCIDEYQYNNNKSATKKNPSALVIFLKSQIHCSGTFVEDFNGAITALATLVIAAFTATLWGATTGQLELLRDEFNSTHRPKIRLKHIWLTKDIQPNDFIEVELNVVNIGNTPATLTEMKFATVILPIGVSLPAIPAFYSSQAIPLRGELPSGITLRISNISNNYKVSANERNSILKRLQKLYCVGYINYFDRKGRLRCTSFCRCFDPPRPPYNNFSIKDYGRFRLVNDPDYEYKD